MNETCRMPPCRSGRLRGGNNRATCPCPHTALVLRVDRMYKVVREKVEGCRGRPVGVGSRPVEGPGIAIDTRLEPRADCLRQRGWRWRQAVVDGRESRGNERGQWQLAVGPAWRVAEAIEMVDGRCGTGTRKFRAGKCSHQRETSNGKLYPSPKVPRRAPA